MYNGLPPVYLPDTDMDPPARKEKSKVKEPVSRVEKAKQKSAQQELKQRQRAEVSEGRAAGGLRWEAGSGAQPGGARGTWVEVGARTPPITGPRRAHGPDL